MRGSATRRYTQAHTSTRTRTRAHTRKHTHTRTREGEANFVIKAGSRTKLISVLNLTVESTGFFKIAGNNSNPELNFTSQMQVL